MKNILHRMEAAWPLALNEIRKETGMENRIYYKDLECYDRATPKQLQTLNKKPYYDLEHLPTDKIRAEFASYIWERGRTVGIITIKAERNYFNSLCRFLEKWGRNVESLLDRDIEQWIRQLKGWMMQEGRMLTRAKVSVYGKPGMERAALIRYFHNVLEYKKLHSRISVNKSKRLYFII